MTCDVIQLESEVGHRYAHPSVPTSTFGKNLRALMAQREIGPSWLLPHLGVKQGTLSDWMRDRRGLPEGPTLLKFAKALRVRVDDLLRGVDDDYDLLCQELEPSSGLQGGPDDPASDAARRLESIRERDGSLAGEVRNAISALATVAARLDEEIGAPEIEAPSGRAGSRKTSGRSTR